MKKFKNHISNFVRYQRRKEGLTQQALAGKAGVGLRFIRDLEQGKESLRLDKVTQVLALFGYELGPVKEKDVYEILLDHMNTPVQIHLKNRKILTGQLIEALNSGVKIDGWRFVPTDQVREYEKTKNQALSQVINHHDIDEIENI